MSTDNFADIELGGCQPDAPSYVILVKLWYFAITTLSTIGYGDFTPHSIQERMLACIILLVGVSTFSFIMS